MSKQPLSQNKGGRPAIGKGELVGIRCQPAFLNAVDEWKNLYTPPLSRPEAIRLLASLGLKAAKRGK